jgi:hypothetical protein
MLLRSTKVLLAGLLVLSVACGGESVAPEDPPDDPVIGDYTLQTINNLPLPVVIEDDGIITVEITAGVVNIFPDGTFNDITDLRITDGGQVSTFVDTGLGTWSRTANVITFTLSGGAGSYAMTWDGGDRLSQLFDGDQLVYER